jgi:hypothetical protein
MAIGGLWPASSNEPVALNLSRTSHSDAAQSSTFIDFDKSPRSSISTRFSIEQLTSNTVKCSQINTVDWQTMLKEVISWTRSIPSFRCLAASDRHLLLQHTWHHLFLITVAADARIDDYRSIGIIDLCDDELFVVNTDDGSSERVRLFIESMTQLQTNINEQSYLKAIVLFKHGLYNYMIHVYNL